MQLGIAFLKIGAASLLPLLQCSQGSVPQLYSAALRKGQGVSEALAKPEGGDGASDSCSMGD